MDDDNVWVPGEGPGSMYRPLILGTVETEVEGEKVHMGGVESGKE